YKNPSVYRGTRKMQPHRSGCEKPSVWHALVVSFLHCFSWGLLTVPYIVKLSDEYGDRAYLVNGLVYGIHGLLTFVTTPLMGALSDFRGRKVVMLIAVVTTYSPIPFMMIRSWWFFAIFPVSGVLGNAYSAAMAYVADVTTAQERSGAYGIMSATYGAGLTLSPILGNFLMDYFGTISAMALATLIGLLNILFIIFIVPESLVQKEEGAVDEDEWSLEIDEDHISKEEKDEQLTKLDKERENYEILKRQENFYGKENKDPVNKELEFLESSDPENTQNLLKVLTELYKDTSLKSIFWINFLVCWPFAGLEDTVPPYLKLNLGFTYSEVSLLLAMVAFFGLISNLMLRWLIPILGGKLSVRLGLVLTMTQLLLFGYGRSRWMMWLAGFMASMATTVITVCSTLASVYTSSENQGAVLGIMSGIESLCDGLGPAVFGVLFYLFQGDSKIPPAVRKPISMPFVTGAVGILVALVLTNFIRKETPLEKEKLYRILSERSD
ncbi:hypothetical protein KR009_001873, partial [Drosophila setifemur]